MCRKMFKLCNKSIITIMNCNIGIKNFIFDLISGCKKYFIHLLCFSFVLQEYKEFVLKG